MKIATTGNQPGEKVERRREKRTGRFSGPMAELRLPNSPPTYQLKLKNLSPSGAGIIVRPDSKALAAFFVGQELRLRLFSPSRSEPLLGSYVAVVKHVSEMTEGRYRGHFVVGVALRKIA